MTNKEFWCPFCCQNCYTEQQFKLHCVHKNYWCEKKGLPISHNLQTSMCLQRFSDEDLEELDAKFDALAEYLEVEFVFEKISDGSDTADKSRVYARSKKKLQALRKK